MRGGKGIKDRFLVLIGDNEDNSTKEAAEQLCGSFSEIAELRPSQEKGITLVRPDGYIAYSAHKDDSLASLASVRALLEPQTLSTPFASAARP
jgi:hypothetical protein